MTDPNTVAMDLSRKLATVRTIAELDTFAAGLILFNGMSWDDVRPIRATRRAELEAGR